MKPVFRCLCRVALASALLVAGTAHAEVAPNKEIDVPMKDVRAESPDSVQKQALRYAREGIVVIYSGEAAQLEDVVRDVAGECAERGFQVKAVFFANSGEGEGVVLYGQDGGPLGPMIRTPQDVKGQTAVQIEKLRERLDRLPSTAALDPQDVVRCRYQSITGSLVRRTKVCTTLREDAQRTKHDKDWTSNQQNRGANEAMPGGG